MEGETTLQGDFHLVLDESRTPAHLQTKYATTSPVRVGVNTKVWYYRQYLNRSRLGTPNDQESVDTLVHVSLLLV
ncbi:hypothetical protein CGGC5_v012557 [Colletotrichum fructicola Nara gc5]|uniref:Uncharacterized protein n=1 Tax=Colletotrichum fructicola (strain Nara gc5) TaxID=1213859 RepID=A0A7J6IRA2_COLFN|nr:hypothetical protein CGGC5_v012557 [Colletotrichum fructicola Nara gc5]